MTLLINMLEQAGEVAHKVLWNKNIWCLALISYNAFSTFEMRAIQDNFFFSNLLRSQDVSLIMKIQFYVDITLLCINHNRSCELMKNLCPRRSEITKLVILELASAYEPKGLNNSIDSHGTIC